MTKGPTGTQGLPTARGPNALVAREDNYGVHWCAMEHQTDMEAVWPHGLPRA